MLVPRSRSSNVFFSCSKAFSLPRSLRPSQRSIGIDAAKRSPPTFEYERQWWGRGYECVVGVDEVGRGALAGPVVAAACALSPSFDLDGLRESKQLTPRARERMFDAMLECEIPYGIGCVDHKEIDRINIREATLWAMKEAVWDLEEQNKNVNVNCVLVDGDMPLDGLSLKYEMIIKGDCLSLTIAAASVIAKVTRDRMMVEYDKQFPHYGFAGHKGYWSNGHVQAIDLHGPCSIHRMTYAPLNKIGRNQDSK